MTYTNVGQTMPFLPPMTGHCLYIYTTYKHDKMVMTGGWFMIVLPTLPILFTGVCYVNIAPIAPIAPIGSGHRIQHNEMGCIGVSRLNGSCGDGSSYL